MMTGSKAKNPVVLAQKGFLVWDPQNTSMQRNYAECEWFRIARASSEAKQFVSSVRGKS